MKKNPLGIIAKPCTKLVIPNDQLTENIFALTSEQLDTLAKGGKCLLTDKKACKKHDAIKVSFKLKFPTPEPLNQFDRAVMSAVTSQFLAGNKFASDNMIFRTICGRSVNADNNPRPTEPMRLAIKHAVEKMSFTKLILDLTNAHEAGYYDSLTDPVLTAPLIFSSNVTGKCSVGGSSTCTIFRIKEEPPLYTLAQYKRQILTCDASLLEVPNQRNTIEIIAIKHYVLQRVLESKAHFKNMARSVTFADVFTKCNLLKISRDKKFKLRQVIVSLFDHFKNCGLISDFTVTRKFGIAYSVEFSFTKKSIAQPKGNSNSQ